MKEEHEKELQALKVNTLRQIMVCGGSLDEQFWKGEKELLLKTKLQIL